MCSPRLTGRILGEEVDRVMRICISDACHDDDVGSVTTQPLEAGSPPACAQRTSSADTKCQHTSQQEVGTIAGICTRRILARSDILPLGGS